jgi:Family of unknown function (DUF6492)
VPPIDIVIPAHPKDRPTLGPAVRGALRYLEPIGRLYVVSREPFASPDARVVWVPEPAGERFPSLEQVRARLGRDGADTSRASWIYQQLLKLGADEYIDGLSAQFLVVDADVLFLRPVSFRAGPGIRFTYAPASEHWPPYRDAYARLLGAPAATAGSLVAHHMLYDRGLLSELRSEIERRSGIRWHEAYADATDPAEPSSISELNTYGWWVLDRHPDAARARPLAWRNVHAVPRAASLRLLALRYDFVAAHAFMRRSRLSLAGLNNARVLRRLRLLPARSRR